MLTLVNVEHRVIKAGLDLVVLKDVLIIMGAKQIIVASKSEHHWEPRSMVDQHNIFILLRALLELIKEHITYDAIVY